MPSRQITRRDIVIGFVLSLTALGLYAGFLSKTYVFEGLIRAMPIETGRWGYLFPGNYLLYGPLGLTFHTLLHLLGFHPIAVVSLQIMDAFIGAAGLFVFYLTLRILGGTRFDSAAWSAVLGCSLGYWLWSSEAENYILSAVLLSVNFHLLVRCARGQKIDPVILGALHGVAILGHIINVIFGVVGLWFLVSIDRREWKKAVSRYAAAAAVVAAIPYAAVLFLIQKPATLRDAINWFQGSAGAAGGALNLGGAYSLAKFIEWGRMSFHILISFTPSFRHPPGWPFADYFLWTAIGLLIVLGTLAAWHRAELNRGDRIVAAGCGLWLLVYAAVFTRWQPGTMVYRVSDLVPFWLCIFVFYQPLSRRYPFLRIGVIALAGCLAIGNFGAEIYPRSVRTNNPHLARMDFLKTHTKEGDWITGDSGQDEIYIPYFAQRRPIVIQRYAAEPQRLFDLIRVLIRQGQSVFVTSRVLEEPFWKSFFGRYGLIPAGEDAGGFGIYRIRESSA